MLRKLDKLLRPWEYDGRRDAGAEIQANQLTLNYECPKGHTHPVVFVSGQEIPETKTLLCYECTEEKGSYEWDDVVFHEMELAHGSPFASFDDGGTE